MNVAVVDLNLGNLSSLILRLKYLGVNNLTLTNDPDKIYKSDKVLLPGVGNFAAAHEELSNKPELKEVLEKIFLEKNKYILAICLGFQLLCESSNESGMHGGFKIFNSKVRKFKATNHFKIPHVGFNQVFWDEVSWLTKDIKSGGDFYFTHSYRALIINNNKILTTNYGEQFMSGCVRDNIAGVQFHPELSKKNGVQLINNFLRA